MNTICKNRSFRKPRTQKVIAPDISVVLKNIYKTEENEFWNLYSKSKIKPKNRITQEVDELREKLISDSKRHELFSNFLSIKTDSQTDQDKICEFSKTPNAFYTYKNKLKLIDVNKSMEQPKQFMTPNNLNKNKFDLPKINKVIKSEKENKVKNFDMFKTTDAKPISKFRYEAGNNINEQIISKPKNANNSVLFLGISMFNRYKDKTNYKYIRSKRSNKMLNKSTAFAKTQNSKKSLNRSVFLDKIIQNCSIEEKNAGRNIQLCNKNLDTTSALADNYNEISKKVDKLSYAPPQMLECLYYLEKELTEDIKQKVKESAKKSKSPVMEKLLFSASSNKKRKAFLKKKNV